MGLYQPLRHLIKILLLLTVFLTPLMGANGNYGYEQAKVLFFIVSISLSGFLWLLARPVFKWTGVSIIAELFIITLFTTSIIGLEPQTSLLGSNPYYQGVILYAYLFLFFLLVSATKIKFYIWAFCLAGSATIVGLLAIGDWIQINFLGHQLPTYAGRVVSSFGQPNFYSGFILLCLPFLYFLQKEKYLSYVLALELGIINFFAVWISGSRTAIFLSVGLLIFLSLTSIKYKKLIILGSILIAGYLLIGIVSKEIIRPFSTNNPDLPTIGVEKRYYFWPILGKLILERSIQGYGLENIAPEFLGYFEKNKHALFEENLKVKPFMFGLKDLNLDRSHNYILDLLLFSGILGLLVWLILVGLLIKKLILSPINAENTALLLGLFTYLIWIQFQNQSVVHLIYFWLLVGMIDRGGDN